MSEAIKLKSCPFCGGEAEMKKLGVICDEGYAVVCSKCKARTALFFVPKADAEPEVLHESTMKLAADKWNWRAGEEAFENAHDEAVSDFSHFLIDKAKDGSIDISDLPDLVAEWKSAVNTVIDDGGGI